MFSTLRSRLWLSYALVILGALLLTALVLGISLVRSPLVYRASLSRLEEVRDDLFSVQVGLGELPNDQLTSRLRQISQDLDVRLLVIAPDRSVLFDSMAGTSPVIRPPRPYQLLRPITGLRDTGGKPWLFLRETLAGGRSLLFLLPRPRVSLQTLFRNDVFRPFLFSGLLALVFSLFITVGLARWIGDPLQVLVTATRRLPEKDLLPLSGPREVRELTSAFNAMSSRLAVSQQAQRDFVANVSHELKTPLTSIQGFAQALEDGTAATPESRRQAVAIIQAEAGRMNRMVLDLLDLARLDAGTLSFNIGPLDLPALLNNVIEKFTPLAQKAGIRIASENVFPVLVRGDGDRLAQVFTILVDNALKFTSPGGNILVSFAQAGSNIQVEVKDDGAGIPEAALPYIFDRFYQVDPARSGGERHGAGLGLAIAREIIQAQGGKITVRSQTGKGSAFTVSLPIHGSEPEKSQ